MAKVRVRMKFKGFILLLLRGGSTTKIFGLKISRGLVKSANKGCTIVGFFSRVKQKILQSGGCCGISGDDAGGTKANPARLLSSSLQPERRRSCLAQQSTRGLPL
jgi:hypothetical protein